MVMTSPYIIFNGNAEEAFNFYKSVFGGEFAMVQRFKGTPEESKLSESDQNKIMHINLPLGKGHMLMGSDAIESVRRGIVYGNNFYVSLFTETKEEAGRIFKELSAGGKVELPIQDTFWGAYFGMFADKFGVNWMVSYDNTNLH